MSDIPKTSITFESWASYYNLAKVLGDCYRKYGKTVTDFFKLLVLVTEKIDGSNLAIRVSDANGEWHIIFLQGRNSIVWRVDKNKFEDMMSINYGNAKNLATLPIAMKNFAVLVAKKLDVKDIIVYGEAIRTAAHEVPSWHPFGYKVPNGDEWELHLLNSATYKLFADASAAMGFLPELYLDHNSLMSSYKKSTSDKPLVTPPPKAFGGSLGTAIDALHPTMLKKEVKKDPKTGEEIVDLKYPPEAFEGYFIVLENNSNGLKWKQGLHEEQKNIPKEEDLVIDLGDVTSLLWYKKVAEIYNSREEYGNRAPMLRSKASTATRNEEKTLVEKLRADVKKGIANIIGKISGCGNIAKESRMDYIINDIAPQVVNEVKKQYIDSDMEVPYEDKNLLTAAISNLKPIIMNVPFTGAATAAKSSNDDDDG